jgi:hypothetical protein
MRYVCKWKQQKLSFTDQSITFKNIFPFVHDTQDILNTVTQLIPSTQSTEAPSTIYVNRKRGEISVKEGKELAKTNKSMKDWLLQKTKPLQLSSVQEDDEAMEVDLAKVQRLAKCKARQTEHLNKALCASLVEELSIHPEPVHGLDGVDGGGD